MILKVKLEEDNKLFETFKILLDGSNNKVEN